MMAFVRGPSARSICAGSICMVTGSMSANTGVAPTCSITWADAQKVNGVVITSSPGPMSWATRARCRAAVHEDRATARLAPT